MLLHNDDRVQFVSKLYKVANFVSKTINRHSSYAYQDTKVKVWSTQEIQMYINNVHRRCSELIIINFHCFPPLPITIKLKPTDICDDSDDDDELFCRLVD